MKVIGVIEKILEKQSGVSKKGKEWQTQDFVINTNEQWNNIYCFALFGSEKIDNFAKYNKIGQTVEVEFNVNCREYEGKYYTNLSAWKVKKVDNISSYPEPIETKSDDLPF